MKRRVDVEQERLYDVQIDGTEILFLRHYVHSAKDGDLLSTYDTDLNGALYERTGIRVSTGALDVYTGFMCVSDPDFPGEIIRVRQFLSRSGQISYTTPEGFTYQIPDNGATVAECGD